MLDLTTTRSASEPSPRDLGERCRLLGQHLTGARLPEERASIERQLAAMTRVLEPHVDIDIDVDLDAAS